MKILKLISILILFISCSDKREIFEFESELGKESSETLNYLVEDFEDDFLKRNYPNKSTEKAYEIFLTDIKNGNTQNFVEISQKTRNLFEKSSLRNDMYAIIDTVWIERNPDSLSINNGMPMIITKLKYLAFDGTFQEGSSESSFNYRESVDEDSIIKRHSKYLRLNHIGKYRTSLKLIADKNKFIENYLDITEEAGIIDPIIIAFQMLESEVDLNNYFIKRLIVTEIAY